MFVASKNLSFNLFVYIKKIIFLVFFTQDSRIMFGSETDWVRNSLLNLRYLIVVAMAGELAAALTQHKGDADNLLGLGQVAEDQAAHLSQAVAEGGFDVSVFMLSRREMKKIT